MAEQSKSLTNIELEAGTSWREWPIYIVMRLKRLQAIQAKLRVGGETASAKIRREELLKAVYDLDEESASATTISVDTAHLASDDYDDFEYDETTVQGTEAAASASEDDDYYEDIEYEDA